MAYPVLTANSPSAGDIAWTAFSIQFNGVGYAVNAGSTADAYVYWLYNSGSPSSTLSVANSQPSLGPNDYMLFLNDNGVPINVAGAQVIQGDLVASGTITGSNIAAGTITGSLIEAGTITSSLIGANEIVANNIAAGAITTSTLDAAGIAANLISGTSISAASIGATTITGSTITGTNINATQIVVEEANDGAILVYTQTTTATTFTSGSGTYTTPMGTQAVRVQTWGAGGGGAANAGLTNELGGGGGEYAEEPSIMVGASVNCSYSVGAGGSAETAGGNTTITVNGTPVTAHGGRGAQGSIPPTSTNGGTGSTNTIHFNGGASVGTSFGSGLGGVGGGAGAGTLNAGANGAQSGGSGAGTGGTGANGGGSGGAGGTSTGNGSAGSAPGGGGGGTGYSGTSAGVGTAGKIIITAYENVLVASISSVSGTDSYGNSYAAGVVAYGSGQVGSLATGGTASAVITAGANGPGVYFAPSNSLAHATLAPEMWTAANNVGASNEYMWLISSSGKNGGDDAAIQLHSESFDTTVPATAIFEFGGTVAMEVTKTGPQYATIPVYHANSTSNLSVTATNSDIVGANISVVVHGSNSTVVVTAEVDANTNASASANVVTTLDWAGSTQSQQSVLVGNGIRATVSQTWVITGLSAGTYTAKLQATGTSGGTIRSPHTSITAQVYEGF